jgi:hypothetical protein
VRLCKTTIVIWSEPEVYSESLELEDLARDAQSGESYCSKMEKELVDDARSDPDWDGTEFFDSDGGGA